MKRFLLKACLLLLIWAGTAEGFAYAALAILEAKGYVRNSFGDLGRDFADYVRRRHPVLGWPRKGDHERQPGYRDRTGARMSPAFPDPDKQPACVSLYGDSFVEGVEVDAEHAWGNVLARTLNCRVSNYGQAGYGSDQALLRYRLNTDDKAPVVILGHMTENILRNLTRLRDLVNRTHDYAFKPRFIVKGGKLILLPMPELNRQQYDRVLGLREPPLILEHENFQPGGRFVPERARFPYTLSLVRATRGYRLRARLRGGLPYFAEFYERGHPSGGLELMTALAEAFRDDTRRRGQAGIFLLLPHSETIRSYVETGKWVHQPLVDELKRRGIPHLDFAPYVVSHLPNALNTAFVGRGHPNEKGSALIAQMAAEYVRTHLATEIGLAHTGAGSPGAP